MLEYPYLFQPGKIGNTTVKNRIVMAPMGEVMANIDGTVSDQMIAYYAERAKGGTGIIIPGFFAVDCSKETSGKPGPIDCRIDEKKFIKNLDLLARAIHRYGSLLVVQISHAGAQTTPESTGGVPPVCVSNVKHISKIP
jgi:2,4-dienoyl-CoA reductase-like NADH-dependent reductase (Old Yellow Enzyme family)